jgi:hypothetical protein
MRRPNHWLDRAKKARALAEQIGDPEAQASWTRMELQFPGGPSKDYSGTLLRLCSAA